MDGHRRALYSYSWQQSPINKRRRANPPEEEKKIFDDWFEEKADEYFPWIRDQGLDDKTIRAANASWTSYSSSRDPEICRPLACVSPMILKRLQRPKQNRKALAEEETHRKAERLASITRYERSLIETRKTIDRIKKEKQQKLMFSRTQHQHPGVVFPEHSAHSGLNEVSSFQKKFCKEQVTASMENGVCGSKNLESKLRSDSFSSTRSTVCSNIGKRVKQSISSESEEQASAYHKDDDSDNELLRLAFESSPIQKSKSAPRIAVKEDDLSDEALLAIMASSPVPSPKLRKKQVIN